MINLSRERRKQIRDEIVEKSVGGREDIWINAAFLYVDVGTYPDHETSTITIRVDTPRGEVGAVIRLPSYNDLVLVFSDGRPTHNYFTDTLAGSLRGELYDKYTVV